MALRQTGEGLPPQTCRADGSLTPHPPLGGTFSLKGRRKAVQSTHAAALPNCPVRAISNRSSAESAS